ncbi:unnamed protein product [Bursaphelenchus xylophilus]|uniref:(pine wood nematode) hypothetical protein n=1 Tax=Bursaphelenchus xylophilus TaxID=6326 RepID=A0A7I8X4C2_BURXY|nr:unnamed protein product [Bursaphelenchus xylophilus]CAG9128861.1 unnamed protein product [Bursaphelenchus xylophilus]
MRPQKRHRFVHLAATICSSASAVLSFPQRARPDGTDQMSPVEQFLYGQQTLIHTFGTPESCARNCPRACTVQEVEDLMMPRWICPSKEFNGVPESHTKVPNIPAELSKGIKERQ